MCTAVHNATVVQNTATTAATAAAAAAAAAAANQSRDLASRQGDACDLRSYLASDQDADSTL
jgi:hypothetical protein